MQKNVGKLRHTDKNLGGEHEGGPNLDGRTSLRQIFSGHRMSGYVLNSSRSGHKQATNYREHSNEHEVFHNRLQCPY